MQSLKLSNPFVPEPSVASEVRIQVLRTTCDVISFNSQGHVQGGEIFQTMSEWARFREGDKRQKLGM